MRKQNSAEEGLERRKSNFIIIGKLQTSVFAFTPYKFRDSFCHFPLLLKEYKFYRRLIQQSVLRHISQHP